jgi:thiaminase (transcriptional activator TenA)
VISESQRLKARGADCWAAAIAHPMVAEIGAGSRGGLAVALAALLPCQWSYGEIGQRLARSLPADPVYRDWIALFAGDGYDELVAASTDLLDSSCTRRDRVATSDAFDRSTRYEIAFWQMAYTRGASEFHLE